MPPAGHATFRPRHLISRDNSIQVGRVTPSILALAYNRRDDSSDA